MPSRVVHEQPQYCSRCGKPLTEEDQHYRYHVMDGHLLRILYCPDRSQSRGHDTWYERSDDWGWDGA